MQFPFKKKNGFQILTPRQCRILTGIFGPFQDGRDLIALLGFADAVASGRIHANGVQVGLHPAQVGSGRGGAVGDLEVHAVRLHVGTQTHGGTMCFIS